MSVAASLDDLTAKIDAGERLSDEDVAALGSSRDIIALGMLASTVRRRLRGNEVTYVRVADLKVDARAGELARRCQCRRLGRRGPHLSDAAHARCGRRGGREGARLPATTPLSAFCLFELGKLPEGLPVVLAGAEEGWARDDCAGAHRSPERARAGARSADRCGPAAGAADGQRNA